MRRPSRPSSWFFLFTGLLLFGCAATAAPPDPSTPEAPATPPSGKLAKPDAEGRFTLAVAGQAEVVPGMVLTLERVVADSRCPVDVTCVWAGEIRVALSLESPLTEAPRLELELATTAPIATARGLEIELLGAEPQPHSAKKIAPEEYRIALRVRRAGSSQSGSAASS